MSNLASFSIVFTFKVLVEKAISSIGYETNLLILDMSKAFDTLKRDIIIEDLRKVLNKDEIERLKAKHPISEHSTMIKGGYLLGQLLPLRAFGDMRYKWSLQDLKKVVSILGSHYAETIIPPSYYTPPYLTVKPEMFHYTLTPRDRFIVIASDGLWECLSNEKVVKLVGDHMESISTQTRFHLDVTMNLGALNRALKKRQPSLANRPFDTNAATHLIRHALGQEHSDIARMLTHPKPRHMRDDITVIVVYLDEQYLGAGPDGVTKV